MYAVRAQYAIRAVGNVLSHDLVSGGNCSVLVAFHSTSFCDAVMHSWYT